MKVSYLIKIKGIVTGVCFRYYTLQEAKTYPAMQGYVKNVYEGNVEVLVQGNKEEVLHFIEWLKHGPSHARVDEIKVNQVPVNKNLRPFAIKQQISLAEIFPRKEIYKLPPIFQVEKR